MEGPEPLKAWIKQFTKEKGRKPKREDMPTDIGKLFTKWQQQKTRMALVPKVPEKANLQEPYRGLPCQGQGQFNRFLRAPIPKASNKRAADQVEREDLETRQPDVRPAPVVNLLSSPSLIPSCQERPNIAAIPFSPTRVLRTNCFGKGAAALRRFAARSNTNTDVVLGKADTPAVPHKDIKEAIHQGMATGQAYPGSQSKEVSQPARREAAHFATSLDGTIKLGTAQQPEVVDPMASAGTGKWESTRKRQKATGTFAGEAKRSTDSAAHIAEDDVSSESDGEAQLGSHSSGRSDGEVEEAPPSRVRKQSTVPVAAKLQSRKGLGKQKQRQNFVRMDRKGGGGNFGYKSKAGAKRRKTTNSRFPRKFPPRFLPQAGDGADYMDGWEPHRSRNCFKCGKPGHWANACPGLANQLEMVDPQDLGEPSAALHPISAPLSATPQLSQSVVAAIQRAQEGECPEDTAQELLRDVFGHQNMRGSQLSIICRVLQGQSLLAILPTGAGKSLCYQLPALMLGGTTLVVSPLIALMRDQLSHLPPGLPAAMLWSGQSKEQAMQTFTALKEGRLRVLYVAPERLHNELLLSALAPILPLPLVVVDEAHCVAEWGHNFRSSYFRLGHLLREKVPCKAVLALTATATRATQQSIMEVLSIPEENVVREGVLPPNLRLAVQHVQAGLQGSVKPALLQLIKASIRDTTTIVYTSFQNQADEIAGYLYVQGLSAASFHGGKSDREKERIQEEFRGRKLQVVVATVAFGMGLDAMHVRSVIHYNLPRSLEEYVQQVGRAGRSGEEGVCHLFLSDTDFQILRSKGHADEVDSCQVESFLEEIFVADYCATTLRGKKKGAAKPSGRFGVTDLVRLSNQLDMKKEVMETLLSYLEAMEGQILRVLPPTHVSVKVSFYDEHPSKLVEKHNVIAALLQTVNKSRQGIFEAPMAAMCNQMLQPPFRVLKALQELAATNQLSFELSGQQNTLAFEILERPADMQALAEQLADRHEKACRQQVSSLDTAYRTFAAAAAVSGSAQQEVLLRSRIREYFEQETGSEAPTQDSSLSLADLPLRPAEQLLGADCRALSLQVGPRAVARILHGLNSPAFPAKEWCTCSFWERYRDVAFSTVLRVARRQYVKKIV